MVLLIILLVINTYAATFKINIGKYNFEENCSIVIQYPKQTICYDNKLHITIATYIIIDKRALEHQNKRLSFRDDKNTGDYVKKCYVKSGYDRSHLAISSFFDYNINLLRYKYLMSNVVPETAYTNRQLVRKVELQISNLLKTHNYLQEVIIIKPSNKYLKGNVNCPIIPSNRHMFVFDENGTLLLNKIIINRSKTQKEVE